MPRIADNLNSRLLQTRVLEVILQQLIPTEEKVQVRATVILLRVVGTNVGIVAKAFIENDARFHTHFSESLRVGHQVARQYMIENDHVGLVRCQRTPIRINRLQKTVNAKSPQLEGDQRSDWEITLAMIHQQYDSFGARRFGISHDKRRNDYF